MDDSAAAIDAGDEEGRPPLPEPDPARPAGFVESPEPTTGGAGGAEKAIAAFMTRAFFLALHERAGDVANHPVRAAVCFWLDLTLRLVASLLFLGVAVAVAWKALAPLPW